MPVTFIREENNFDAVAGHILEMKLKSAISTKNISYLTGVRNVESRVGDPKVVAFLNGEIKKLKEQS